MRGLNLVLLGGNLGNDPEVRHTTSGVIVATFDLAISTKAKMRDGNYEEKVEWVKVVCFGSVADSCSKYISKGDAVFVIGRVKNRSYEDRDGAKKKVTDIIGDRVQFLTTKRRERNGAETDHDYPPEDDVPF